MWVVYWGADRVIVVDKEVSLKLGEEIEFEKEEEEGEGEEEAATMPTGFEVNDLTLYRFNTNGWEDRGSGRR